MPTKELACWTDSESPMKTTRRSSRHWIVCRHDHNTHEEKEQNKYRECDGLEQGLPATLESTRRSLPPTSANGSRANKYIDDIDRTGSMKRSAPKCVGPSVSGTPHHGTSHNTYCMTSHRITRHEFCSSAIKPTHAVHQHARGTVSWSFSGHSLETNKLARLPTNMYHRCTRRKRQVGVLDRYGQN